MSTLLSDLRHAVRSLLKSPGLTLAAVLSLALGIGANTTIFTWVQAVLFRPIPVAAEPNRILIPAMTNREGQDRSWSYPNYTDFRDRATLVDIVAQDDQTFSIAIDGAADRAWGGLVTGNYFSVMGVTPAAGRCSRTTTTRIPAVIRWWCSVTPTGSGASRAIGTWSGNRSRSTTFP